MGLLSPYDNGFAEHLEMHGCYSARNPKSERPSNFDDINRVMRRHRDSLSSASFTEQHFKAFDLEAASAYNEASVMHNLLPLVAGELIRNPDVCFSNVQHLTNGTLVAPQPDAYYGEDRRTLEGNVLDKLDKFIVPSKTPYPVLPNFFIEAKGPTGVFEIATRQILYDGAIGARAMHMARQFVDADTALDNYARTFGAIFHGFGDQTVLTLYSFHVIPSEDAGQPLQYSTTKVASFLMNSSEAWRDGARAFRNLRDFASEQRKELVAAMNLAASTSATPGQAAGGRKRKPKH